MVLRLLSATCAAPTAIERRRANNSVIVDRHMDHSWLVARERLINVFKLSSILKWSTTLEKIMYDSANLGDLMGKTISSINVSKDEIHFYVDDPEVEGHREHYVMQHHQNCCERVSIEEIIGDINDLVGSPILMAEESVSKDDPARDDHYGSHTWTFYKFATNKGYVTIRWYGTSNGYYSESVSFDKV